MSDNRKIGIVVSLLIVTVGVVTFLFYRDKEVFKKQLKKANDAIKDFFIKKDKSEPQEL